jgi:hypothetical protein
MDLLSLAARLPDIPRWVETRSALLGGSLSGCEIFGARDDDNDDDGMPESFIVRSDGTLFIVGEPSRATIEEALIDPKGEIDDVLGTKEAGDAITRALPDRFVRTIAILHTLPDLASIKPFLLLDGADVRVIDPSTLSTTDDDLPTDLLEEIRFMHPKTPLVAAFEDGRPVAFSYAGAMSETLWDLSIDTLEGHRRRGHAARCAAFLIDHLERKLGIRPLWGAVTQNSASLSLAKKLGFRIVDEIVYWESDPTPAS